MTVVLMVLALAFAAPASAEQGAPIPPAAIDDLMVTPEEASSVMGAAFPVVDRRTALSDLTTDRPDCGSVVGPSVATYDRGPYMAAHEQYLQDSSPWNVQVAQRIAVFPTDAEARNFASSEMDMWLRCAKHTVHDSAQWRYVIGSLHRDDDAVVGSYVMITNDGARMSCSRVLARVRNTATDLRGCSAGPESYQRLLGIAKIIGPRYDAA
ncbi:MULTISPECIES: sensor domain-containing protein [unclassified Mycobacterium]|uniref:sensor domain-containing protein n=1 Tax=unclassified Mycobacterium TaxID=2642494 RepID=UPI001116A19C|nr:MULTISPECIES: sensor domain-containing protein [unclassified Mycobacterium]